MCRTTSGMPVRRIGSAVPAFFTNASGAEPYNRCWLVTSPKLSLSFRVGVRRRSWRHPCVEGEPLLRGRTCMNKRLSMLEKLTASPAADAFAWYGLAMEYRNEQRIEDALQTF